MEEDIINSLVSHSEVDISQTISNLTDKLQTQLQKGYQYDTIHSYCKDLNLVKHLLTCARKNSVITQESNLTNLCDDILKKVCMPLISQISPTRDSRENVIVLLGSVCRLAACCVSTNEEIPVQFLKFIKTGLETFLEEKPTNEDLTQIEGIIDVYSVCEVLCHVLQVFKENRSILENSSSVFLILRDIFIKLVDALEIMQFNTVGSVFIPTLTKLFDVDKDNQSMYLGVMWKTIQTFSKHSEERKHYLLLCGFANFYFPIDVTSICCDILSEAQLWNILQCGLLSKDSLNRKRCLYLVKRIIDICEHGDHEVFSEGQFPTFWWKTEKKTELSKVWEDFMLLAEVFEEKQVHVIKPLLPRMKNLIEASTLKEKQGHPPLLHTSWIKTLLMRCNHHESLQIIRWSTETALTLDYSLCPFFEQGQGDYLSGAVLESLHEPKLFVREQGYPMGSLPVIALRLEQFFSTCSKSLSDDKKGSFFCSLVQNICNTDWGPYSLLFICRGLSLVPSSPCLDGDTIALIRKLLTGHLVSIDAYLRGATICYIVETVIHLADKSKVSVDEFMQMLAVVDRDVCLQRGTTLWSSCVDWLKQEVEESSDWSSVSMKRNIELAVNKYLQISLDSSYSLGDHAIALVLARQMLLCYDAGIATDLDESQSSCWSQVLERLTLFINSINTHAYMSVHKADKAVQLLVLIVQEAESTRCKPDDPVLTSLLSAITSCQEELSTFVSNQMGEALTSLTDMGLLKMYLAAVQMLTLTVDESPCSSLKYLVKSCINILRASCTGKETSLQSKLKEVSSMCIMGLLADFLSHDKFVRSQEVRTDVKDLKDSIVEFAKTWSIRLTLQKPSTEDILNQQEWGRVTSVYLLNQWRMIRLCLLCNSQLWCKPEYLLNLSTESLSVGMSTTTIPIMQSVKLILPHVLSKSEVDSVDGVVMAMDACLASLLEVGSSIIFWQVLEVFVEAIFQPCLLRQEKDSLITNRLNQISDRLLAMSEKQGVVLVMVRSIFESFLQSNMCQHAVKFSLLIKEFCINGAILKRGNRQVFDICAALEDMGDSLSANQILNGFYNQDILARVVTFNFLCSLDPTNPIHSCLATSIVKQCIAHYKRMPMNAFANSLIHLQRHRLIQTVLLLECFITEDYVSELWNFAWIALQQELQPSVRHMLEWIAMRLMYRYDHLAQQLWVIFDKYQETKNIIVCSLLCIVTHMGPHLPTNRQEEYYQNALSKILPWCLAHHFNTRIFAQAAIVKLWQQCRTLELDSVLKAHAILGCLVDFNQQNKNSTKNVKKLLDSFFFKFLDFRRDFSLETLFYLLPMMTHITEEDWIKPEQFVQVHPEWKRGNSSQFIQLKNTTNHLSGCGPELWKYKRSFTTMRRCACYQQVLVQWFLALLAKGQKSLCNGFKNPDDIDDIFGDLGKGDVQKKIMPWKQMVPDEETSLEIEHGVKPQREDGLIVVTSLINKVPNLGGLCRTSEIFGVSEYIMGSMKFLEDKAFQSLSVTAHKWLPITEVHESRLADYLQQKREEGYCLVGAEQTANSVCLTEYKFPQKTLLLLGNEKEGIPVDLISLLDVCVEIPQQGVVRSLNVHYDQSLHWKDKNRQSTSHNDSTSLADTNMVSGSDEDSCRKTQNHSQKEEVTNTSAHGSGTSSGKETDPNCMPCVGNSFRNRGLSRKATSILIASWRMSTRNQYKSYISKWLSFCGKRQASELSPSVNHVIEFLTDLYEKGHSYNSLNTARSALSSLGNSLESYTAGTHPLVVRFLKGVFNIRPPQPRYTKIWDVNKVLVYLRKLSPVKTLSMKDLTLKFVMLMVLTNAARIHTVNMLTVRNLQKTKSEFVVEIDGLVKQSRPGTVVSSLSFKAYPPDRRLCIYFVIKEYLSRTTSLRNNGDTKLLISYVKPYKGVSKDTVARWIKTVMIRAGIDVTVFGPHSVRAAVTSKASEKSVPISDILKTAGWSNVGTFKRFYEKPIQKDDTFAKSILQM